MVTGKLDVRGVALPALDGAAEVDALADLGEDEALDAEELELAEEVADGAD